MTDEPLTDEQLDRFEESWRQGRPLPGAVHRVLAEIRRLREETAELREANVQLTYQLKAQRDGLRAAESKIPGDW